MFHFSQILTSLEIIVPLSSLLSMFQVGVDSLAQFNTSITDDSAPTVQQVTQPDVPLDDLPLGSPLSPTYIQQISGQPRVFTFDVPQVPPEEDPMDYKNITCFIIMLDLILKQVGTTCK